MKDTLWLSLTILTGLAWGTDDAFGATVAEQVKGQVNGGVRSLTTSDPSRKAGLTGWVIEVNDQGGVQGGLPDATLRLVNGQTTITATTDQLGESRFGGLNPGTYSLTASKVGYYSGSPRTISLGAGETRSVTLQLAMQSGPGSPSVFDVLSPNGRHFIEGMPGHLSFEVTVAWNGSPGSVDFTIAGTPCPGVTLTDLGGGLARASLTIAAPTTISNCGEVTVKAVNGEGKKTSTNTGVHFYPLPGSITSWYGDSIPWVPSGAALSYVVENTRGAGFLPDNLQVGSWPIEATLTEVKELCFDPLAGQFRGEVSRSFEAEVDTTSNPLGYKVRWLGAAKGGLDGGLKVSLAGCESQTAAPAWNLDFSGGIGIGVPTALFVEPLMASAASASNSLLAVPVVSEVVGSLETQWYVVFGVDWRGLYPNGAFGDDPLLLYAKQVEGTGTVGVEMRGVLALHGASVAVYGGGTAALPFALPFKVTQISGYVGVSAEYLVFQYDGQVGVEFSFEENQAEEAEVTDQYRKASYSQPTSGHAQLGSARLVGVTDLASSPAWRPIGDALLKWGAANRLLDTQPAQGLEQSPVEESRGSAAGMLAVHSTQPASLPDEETVVRNVTSLASPSVICHASQPLILFSLHDPSKPWYAATDVASVQEPKGGPWSLNRVTDDQAAEFSPKVIEVGTGKALAAWERVSGNISTATGPGQVAPHLEIVAAWLDHSTGLWSQPVQLTSNNGVDRSPQPIVFRDGQGILWIENQADAMIGDAKHGDRLLFARGSPNGWNAPEALWSDPNGGGILHVGCVAGGDGEAYAVFSVDRDGNLATRSDRELYRVATAGGVWQKAVQWTRNAFEDASPTLVAPGGVPMCVWTANDVLVYSRLGTSSPRPVYSEPTDANDTATLAGITLPMGAAIAYTTQGPNGVDIVASFYDTDLDLWSQPRQLTHDEHAEIALSLACDGGDLVIAYLKTQTLRQDLDIEINGQMQHLQDVLQPGRTDLCVLRHAAGYDLAVGPGSLGIEPSNPAPGQTATISVTVENQGDLSLSNVRVRFYDGDPNRGGTPIGDVQVLPGVLIAGGKQNASVTWTVPTAELSHEIFAVVDPNGIVDDRNLANNSASISTVLPDLVAETCWSTDFSIKEVLLTGRVMNTGAILAGPFRASWHLNTESGEEIGASDVEMLAAGGTYEVTCIWDTTGRMDADGAAQVFLVVDPAGAIQEASKGNNSTSCMVFASSATGGPGLKPVACWTFDEGSGTVAHDAAGTNHGTVHGAQWTTGKIGGALRFDGVDDYVDCGSNAALSPSQMTVALWLKLEGGAGTRNVLRKGAAVSTDNEYQLLLTTTGQVAGSFNKGTQNVMVRSLNPLPNNEWVHIAFTRDGNEAALYVNGADRAAVSYTLMPVTGTGPLYIGRGVNQPYKGSADDVRIYDQPLTEDEIKTLVQEAGN